jgi:XisH protein
VLNLGKSALEDNAAIDLGAEKLIAAERGSEKIAVEIKSFSGASFINDLENAWG